MYVLLCNILCIMCTCTIDVEFWFDTLLWISNDIIISSAVHSVPRWWWKYEEINLTLDQRAPCERSTRVPHYWLAIVIIISVKYNICTAFTYHQRINRSHVNRKNRKNLIFRCTRCTQYSFTFDWSATWNFFQRYVQFKTQQLKINILLLINCSLIPTSSEFGVLDITIYNRYILYSFHGNAREYYFRFNCPLRRLLLLSGKLFLYTDVNAFRNWSNTISLGRFIGLNDSNKEHAVNVYVQRHSQRVVIRCKCKIVKLLIVYVRMYYALYGYTSLSLNGCDLQGFT